MLDFLKGRLQLPSIVDNGEDEPIPDLDIYKEPRMDSFCSDKSFEDESLNNVLDFDMQNLNLHRFFVKDRYYTFLPNDPIFTLKEAAKVDATPLKVCGICSKKNFRIDSVTCQFCGLDVCSDCCHKSRAYPRALQKKNGETDKGLCCDKCDRKFHIKTWIGKYMVRVKGDLINDEILSRKYNHYLHKEIELKCKSNAERWRMCAKIRNVKYDIK